METRKRPDTTFEALRDTVDKVVSYVEHLVKKLKTNK